MTWNPRDGYRKYAVSDVRTVEEFLRRYYKPDRITHMLPAYPDFFETLAQSRGEDLARDGVTIISHFDSVTGEVVAFYE